MPLNLPFSFRCPIRCPFGNNDDFRKSGLEHLALSFRDVRLFKDETPDLLLKQMRLFASEIMPAFRT